MVGEEGEETRGNEEKWKENKEWRKGGGETMQASDTNAISPQIRTPWRPDSRPRRLRSPTLVRPNEERGHVPFVPFVCVGSPGTYVVRFLGNIPLYCFCE